MKDIVVVIIILLLPRLHTCCESREIHAVKYRSHLQLWKNLSNI